MFNREKTKTSLFLLPLLTYKEGGNATEVLWNTGLFNNTYLKIDTDLYKSEDFTLNVRYNWIYNKVTFDKYEEILKVKFKDFQCINVYSCDTTSEMMVFKIPDYYKDIYYLFLEGKYSCLPEKYKQHLLDFTSQPKDGKIHRILYKSKLLKEEMEKKLGCKIPNECELYDPPYLEQETFTNELMVNRKQLKIKI